MEGTTSAPQAAPVSTPTPTEGGQKSSESGSNLLAGKPTVSTESQRGQKQPQSTPPSSELYDVKVDNKIVKMTRQEVLDNASMASAARERFNEASRMRKEYEDKHSKYAKNPIDAFLEYTKELPPEKRRQVLEDYYLREYIEPETLTAEQKQLKELQAFKAQRESADAEKAEQERIQQEEQLTTKERTYLQEQIIEAMETSGLPKTKFFISRMAFYMRQNLVNGWEAPLPLIVKQVQQERQATMSDMANGATAEQLIALLGDGIINKIRTHDLQKLRESRKGPMHSSNAGTGPISTNEKISSSEVNKRLRDMRSGKFTGGG